MRYISYFQNNQKWDLIFSHRQAIGLLQEGYEILMYLLERQHRPENGGPARTVEIAAQIEELRKPIQYMESLVEKIVSYLKECQKKGSSGKIDSEYKIEGFIDLFEVLEEYKFALMNDPQNASLMVNAGLVRWAFEDLEQFKRMNYVLSAATASQGKKPGSHSKEHPVKDHRKDPAEGQQQQAPLISEGVPESAKDSGKKTAQQSG